MNAHLRSTAIIAICMASCSNSDPAPSVSLGAGLQARTVTDVNALLQAAKDLQAAVPVPEARGWDATADAEAISNAKNAWKRARIAYEHIEGVIAPLFPDIDAVLDERYDGFMEELTPKGDPDLFDDKGITGMHAIERILFVKETRAAIIAHEQTTFKNTGYIAAAWPSTHEEALRFRDKLCGRLIKDIETLKSVWVPQNLDAEGAYDGLEGLVAEQREKITNAASSQEESRYANFTLADLRANLEGVRNAFVVFETSIARVAESKSTLAAIHAGFERLDALYKQYPGDAIPEAPAGFEAEAPTAEQLNTPFGKLWSGVQKEVDIANTAGLLSQVQKARPWALRK